MLITMIKTRRVSEDGFVTRYLEKDATYEVMDTAARACIASGDAYEPGTRPLVIDWRDLGSLTKEDISADISRVLNNLPNPAMKGFNANNVAKSLYESYEKGEYDVSK